MAKMKAVMDERIVAEIKKKLEKEILFEAKVLNMHMGAAEAITEKVIESVSKWVEERAEITEDDINRETAKQLKKYNADLAYIFKNRGKII
mgnify:CR=1 FL=1